MLRSTSGRRIPTRPELLAVFTTLVVTSSFLPAQAQTTIMTDEELSLQEPLVVNYPSAGILDHGTYRFEGRIGPESSVLLGTLIGFQGRFQLGVYYGFQGLLDTGSIETNPRPGFRARLRIVDEGQLPAIAIGYDGQGYGTWNDALKRYQRKSPGFYAVVSRNYVLLGDLSLSGGINYSLENENDDNINLFGSVTKQVYAGWSLLLEYDAAFNDRSGSVYGRGRGYLDAAIRWRYAHLDIKFMLHDLLDNSQAIDGISRELEISYVGWF